MVLTTDENVIHTPENAIVIGRSLHEGESLRALFALQHKRNLRSDIVWRKEHEHAGNRGRIRIDGENELILHVLCEICEQSVRSADDDHVRVAKQKVRKFLTRDVGRFDVTWKLPMNFPNGRFVILVFSMVRGDGLPARLEMERCRVHGHVFADQFLESREFRHNDDAVHLRPGFAALVFALTAVMRSGLMLSVPTRPLSASCLMDMASNWPGSTSIIGARRVFVASASAAASSCLFALCASMSSLRFSSSFFFVSASNVWTARVFSTLCI